MKRNAWSVECVGTSALISHWQTWKSVGDLRVCRGEWRGAISGNDAVIVAHELKKRGLISKCRLLDPTSADLKSVRLALTPSQVFTVGGGYGRRTRSLCLEDATGERKWIFSRIPSPLKEIGVTNADFLYVDYYPELADYLNNNLKDISEKIPLVMVNLSSITPRGKAPTLAFKPSIVQVSVSSAVELRGAFRVAKWLSRTTGARMSFVTLGVRGAVLETGGDTWHFAVTPKQPEGIMGAGAFFSSEVIVGLSQRLDGEELLRWAVIGTARRLGVDMP